MTTFIFDKNISITFSAGSRDAPVGMDIFLLGHHALEGLGHILGFQLTAQLNHYPYHYHCHHNNCPSRTQRVPPAQLNH